MPTQTPTNEAVAGMLEQIADLLEHQDDNPYRVQAFRRGARTVRATSTPLSEIIKEEGGEALTDLEGIGEGLASTIFEFITTGRSNYLQALQERQSPQELFQQVPGIGPKLAERIAYELQLTSLEGLEQAAHDGRLRQVSGIGPRTLTAIQHSLAELLKHAGRQAEPGPAGQPPVPLLLEVDADYRRQAAADELPRLSPRRFNPKNEAWLPLLRTEREGWAMTVLFSNTARAHDLDKTHDWVVIYYQKEGPEDQCTVVTESSGPLKGKRVIRGRERECREFYQKHP